MADGGLMPNSPCQADSGYALELRGVSKKPDTLEALAHIYMSVRPGDGGRCWGLTVGQDDVV